MRTLEEIRSEIRKALDAEDLSTVPSLLEELEQHNSDEARGLLHVYRGLYAASNQDYTSALEHYEKALTLYQETGAEKSKAVTLTNIGNVYLDTQQYDRAIEIYLQALNVLEKFGNTEGIAQTYGNLAMGYNNKGDHAAALDAFNRSLAGYERLKNTSQLARTMGNISILYADVADYTTALDYLQRSLQLSLQLKNNTGVAAAYLNMSMIYSEMEEAEKAMEFIKKGLAIVEELGNRPMIAMATNNIGILYQSLGDVETALQKFDTAFALHTELKEVSNAARALVNRVLALFDLERYEEAEEDMKMVGEIKVAEPQIQIDALEAVSKFAEHRQQPEEAWQALEDALVIAKRFGVKIKEIEIYLEMRNMAQRLNDFESYIKYNNAYTDLKEETIGRQTSMRLAVQEKQREISEMERERERERAVLHATLPEEVANRLIRGEDVSGDHFDHVSVLFLDIVGFTTISDRIPPGHVVHLLKAIFKVCDDVCKEHGITKIKTIGDSYLAVGGLPEPLEDHVQRTAQAACAMLEQLTTLELTMDPKLGDTSWTKDIGEINVRIGLHCGPLVAGIVGDERLQYDVWGDTVNVASRMESTGEPGRIQVSEAFVGSLTSFRDDAASPLTLERGASEGGGVRFRTTERGEIDIKGKGTMKTYWLEGA